MNIKVNLYYNVCSSLLKESIFPILPVQHKKIIIIASIAFGCLAVCYAISRCCLKATHKLAPSSPKSKPATPKPLKENDDNDVLNETEIKILPDGTICEGNFKEGLLNGKGKISYPNGIIFEANFQNDRPSKGHAKKTYPNGKVEEGNFDRYCLDDDETYRMVDGEIKVSFPDKIIFEGKLNDLDIYGEGKLTYPDGLIIKGDFNNYFEEGIITSAKGVVLEGSFDSDGNLYTKFEVKFPDGKILKGQFDDNDRLQGKIRQPNGEVFKGELTYSLSSDFHCFNSKNQLINLF